MRIAALVTEAFGGYGGIALYNRDLLRSLCELPDVRIIHALPRLVRADPQQEDLSQRLDFRLQAATSNFRYFIEVARLARFKPRYDLILCGHINLLPVAEALRRCHHAPLLLFVYGIDAWQPSGRWLVDSLARRSDVIVSISKFTAQRFMVWSRVSEKRVFILPNALHPEAYGPGPKPLYLEASCKLAGKKVLLTLGRLSAAERYKGVDEMLELMPKLLEYEPNIRYLVVGEGDDRARLQKKAETLNLKNHTVFAGAVAEKDKANYYRLADVFVMVGRGEGFGFVFLEAMACGIPVVASKLDGSREAVRDGGLGLLADPDDSQSLFETIVKALALPRRVPEGLEYFYYPRFRERFAKIIDLVLSMRFSVA